MNTTSTELVRADPFSSTEPLIVAGFLAGYSGLTRDAYALHLRCTVGTVLGDAEAEGKVSLLGIRDRPRHARTRHHRRSPHQEPEAAE